MRVTNSMLATNLLRNLHSNFNRSNNLQNMMATGRRFAHISDNPTAMLYAQSARNNLARLSHFQRTTETAQSWLYQAETSMRELQDVLVNVYEALADATTDVKTDNDRNNIAQVIGQMRNHFVDTLNSTFGNNFIFGGYNTTGDSAFNTFSPIDPETGLPFPESEVFQDTSIRPFVVINNELHFNGFNISRFDGIPAEFLHNFEDALADVDLVERAMTHMGMDSTDADEVEEFERAIAMLHRLKSDVVTFDVGPGIEMPVTMNGIDLLKFTTMCETTGQPLMRNAFSVIQQIHEGTSAADWTDDVTVTELSALIRPIQNAQDHMLARVAEVGGRSRRLEMLEARYDQDRVNKRQMLSDAEDVDMAEVIMELRMAEAVMQASMAAGARVIQPSLMDFLR